MALNKIAALPPLQINIPPDHHHKLNSDAGIFCSISPIYGHPTANDILVVAYHSPKPTEPSATPKYVSASHIDLAPEAMALRPLPEQCEPWIQPIATHDLILEVIVIHPNEDHSGIDPVVETISSKAHRSTPIIITQVKGDGPWDIILNPNGTRTIVSNTTQTIVSPRFRAGVLHQAYLQRKDALNPPLIKSISMDDYMLKKNQRPIRRCQSTLL